MGLEAVGAVFIQTLFVEWYRNKSRGKSQHQRRQELCAKGSMVTTGEDVDLDDASEPLAN